MADQVAPNELPQSVQALLAKKIIGPLLLGSHLNCWLYGVVLLQMRTYFLSSSRDPLWQRITVCVILIVDTVNTAFLCWSVYDFTITKFGDIQADLFIATPAFRTNFITSGLAVLMIQCCFAWRVKSLASSFLLGGLIVSLALTQFGVQLYNLIRGIQLGDVRTWGPALKAPVMVWLIGAAVTDLLIAGTLVTFFRRNRTGFGQTDDILSHLTRLAIQTGAFTAMWATVDLIVYLVIPDNTHFILNLPLNKLYTISLLSSLNARLQWRGERSGPTTGPLPSRVFVGLGSPGRKQWDSTRSHELATASNSSNGHGVHVSTTTEIEDPTSDVADGAWDRKRADWRFPSHLFPLFPHSPPGKLELGPMTEQEGDQTPTTCHGGEAKFSDRGLTPGRAL